MLDRATAIRLIASPNYRLRLERNRIGARTYFVGGTQSPPEKKTGPTLAILGGLAVVVFGVIPAMHGTTVIKALKAKP